MYKIEVYNESHYDLINSWLKDHKWDSLPLDLIPKNGIVVHKDNKPLCTGFLYKTDSSFCFIEFIVYDPKEDINECSFAIDELLKALHYRAKSEGFKYIMASTNNLPLVNKYKEQGFETSSNHVTNLIKRI